MLHSVIGTCAAQNYIGAMMLNEVYRIGFADCILQRAKGAGRLFLLPNLDCLTRRNDVDVDTPGHQFTHNRQKGHGAARITGYHKNSFQIAQPPTGLKSTVLPWDAWRADDKLSGWQEPTRHSNEPIAL